MPCRSGRTFCSLRVGPGDNPDVSGDQSSYRGVIILLNGSLQIGESYMAQHEDGSRMWFTVKRQDVKHSARYYVIVRGDLSC
jgi:hypothetical protein